MPAPQGPSRAEPFACLTVEEAAAALRVDISDVIEAIRGGALPGNELRGHWRINSADLETWLKGAWRQ
ncbi:helix-turn-helix domain-containing protein [Cellulomonas aerilata]|uniref:Helix-turn-helix domain-containing protein n=1 Tax=Cellulomonas aerilata TaxID=515326 RepID=A0A512DAP5_9CELL|nr:helix-turn-helix domain-containing protein [Cellulomonas aerilata]GEO33563.1 hypothetical protein CAE01nite_12880 [Cellulomonas aerilata]